MVRRREWIGGALLALSVAGAASGAAYVDALLHPLAGTAFVLLADATLERRRGRSPFSSEPQALVWMATLSVFVWVALEALNERRGLWAYLGWPSADLLRYAALGWWFATILPVTALIAETLAGAAAWDRKASRVATVASVVGLIVYGLAVRGPLPGGNDWWLSGGIAGMFLAGGGLSQPPRRIAAWAAAGLLWIGASEAVNRLASAERFLVSPDGFSPILWPAALLLGPALGGLYQAAAGRLGLASWPPQEALRSSGTIIR